MPALLSALLEIWALNTNYPTQVACLAVCAPLAAELPLYAACLAACTASGTEGEPVEAEAIVEAYLNEHK